MKPDMFYLAFDCYHLNQTRSQTFLCYQTQACAYLYPNIHWIGGSKGPKAGLDAAAKGKHFAPAGCQTPFVQSVVRHCINWATVSHLTYDTQHTLLSVEPVFYTRRQWSLLCLSSNFSSH
jgi:hypothetical protein